MITKELLGQVYTATQEEKLFLDQFINADRDSQFLMCSALSGDPFCMGVILATLEDEHAKALEYVKQKQLEEEAS